MQHMQEQADHSADQRAIDPDILEVTPDSGLKTVRHGLRIPAPDCLGYELYHRTSVACSHADQCAARELIDRGADTGVTFERAAHRFQNLAELAGEHRIGVARCANY